MFIIARKCVGDYKQYKFIAEQNTIGVIWLDKLLDYLENLWRALIILKSYLDVQWSGLDNQINDDERRCVVDMWEHEIAYFVIHVAHPLPKVTSFLWRQRVACQGILTFCWCWYKPLLTFRILFVALTRNWVNNLLLACCEAKPEITMFVSRLSWKCSILWININQHSTALSRARKWKSIKFCGNFLYRKENWL